jgi:fatty-acyl-CoA synthase
MHFDDMMLVILPLFHSGGLFIQAAPVIYKGATMVIHPKFDPVKVYQDIERYQVTKFLGVPTVYRALVKVDPQERGDISSLKVCAGGGEKTTPELFEKCREAGLAFRQVMGQTETSILRKILFASRALWAVQYFMPKSILWTKTAVRLSPETLARSLCAAPL